MKANRAIRNDRAEVGVGTLIVFIAMVLVAAVAAAVLINTTGSLQQRAQATGKDATQEVSSNLKVLNVYGVRGAATDIQELKINVQLSAGALPMDLEQLIIRYSDGTAAPVNYVWAAAESITQFDPTWIRPDNDPTGATGDAVMEAGHLVELHFLIDTDIPERTAVSISLVPEAGSAVIADFTTPATFGDHTSITLR